MSHGTIDLRLSGIPVHVLPDIVLHGYDVATIRKNLG